MEKVSKMALPRLLPAVFAALAFVAVACGKKADSRPVIAVSLEPQRYILEQLVGDRFRVVSVLPQGGNPETFDPTLTSRRDVDNSAVYFTIGNLPFENTVVRSLSPDVKIVDTSAGIDPIYGTHGHGHSNFVGDNVRPDDFADPHYWASVKNMRKISRVMYNQMLLTDPEHADEYDRRFMALDRHLDSLDRAFTERLAAAKDSAFLVWHPTLSYFARDYGFEQISVSADNKEVSLQTLRNVIDEAREHGVRVFFSHGYCNPGQAEAVIKGTGARLVEVDAARYDWEDQLNKVVDELTRD